MDEMRVLSWLTEHFFVKMPPKPKKPKKGDAVGISPLKKPVNNRRAAAAAKKAEDKNEDNSDTSTPKKLTPVKGGKKLTAAEKKQSKKKLTLKVFVNEDNNNEQIDNFDLAGTEASLAFPLVTVPSPDKAAAQETPEVVPHVVTDVPVPNQDGKPARQSMYNFTEEQKSALFDWLALMEMLPVTNKDFKVNSAEWQDLLNKKAAEFVHGKTTCNGKQLYNMFKTKRRCYTNYTTLLNKSGQEAAPELEVKHSALEKHIIAIYTRHAQSTGSVPITRPRHTLKSKVSISCLILNI